MKYLLKLIAAVLIMIVECIYRIFYILWDLRGPKDPFWEFDCNGKIYKSIFHWVFSK